MATDHVGPVRVAVLNDYEIVVNGIARMLEPYADRVRVVETSTGIPSMGESDVVLYDTFSQAQGNVLEVQEVSSMTGAAVVLYSWNLDPTLVAEALRRGAAGYLSKTLDGAGLADAVVKVASGERVLPGDRANGVEHGFLPPEPRRTDTARGVVEVAAPRQ